MHYHVMEDSVGNFRRPKGISWTAGR